MRLETFLIISAILVTFSSLIITIHIEEVATIRARSDTIFLFHEDVCSMKTARFNFIQQIKDLAAADGFFCPHLESVIFILQHPNLSLFVWSGTALFDFACLLILVFIKARTQKRIFPNYDNLDDKDSFINLECIDVEAAACTDTAERNLQETIV